MEKYIKNIDQVIEKERASLRKEMKDFRGTIDDIIREERTNIRKYILGAVDLKIDLNNDDLRLIKEVDNL